MTEHILRVGARCVEVIVDSITRVGRVDAVVSSDDNRLTHGGGVSAAIWASAGPRLALAVAGEAPDLAVGDVWASPAGALSARRILHAVTVDFDAGRRVGAGEIQPLFWRVLVEAERQRCQSLALPLLGTGAGGLSTSVCAHALAEVLACWARGPGGVERIVIVDPGATVAAQLYAALSARFEGLRPLESLMESALSTLSHRDAVWLETAWEGALAAAPGGARVGALVEVFQTALGAFVALRQAEAEARLAPLSQSRAPRARSLEPPRVGDLLDALSLANSHLGAPLSVGLQARLVESAMACERLGQDAGGIAAIDALKAGIDVLLTHLADPEAREDGAMPAPTPRSAGEDVQPGRLIKGQYEIVALRAEGGFGQVFEGIQRPIGRKVAIKVLKALGESARARFLSEARAAARLAVPGVVTIHDFGALPDGRPFLVMEWLEGRDLGEELEVCASMDAERAARLWGPCLEALAEAHQQGIVHRDLKPSNLFICRAGQARERMKILDFGIAAWRAAPTSEAGPVNPTIEPLRLTQPGQALGTPRYMAPEMLSGEPVTPAADVYQVGLILAEMLSGRPAVAADNWLACAVAHADGSLDIPPQVLGGPLGALIAKATRRDPEARFRDGDALRAAMLGARGASAPSASVSAERRALTDFVQLDAGTFEMGSPEDELGRGADERLHAVTLTRALLVQTTPVTQAQWRAVMRTNPSTCLGDTLPVQNISWFDAVAFCNALSRREGLTECYWLEDPRGTPGLDFVCAAVVTLGDCDGYRLPTEAEWEYAARAGDGGSTYGPLDEVAWTGDNSGEAPRGVGGRKPNGWGLYDTLGNIWEWVWDWYTHHPDHPVIDPTGPDSGAFKIARGGSWRSVAWAARLANRTRHAPTHRYKDTGLRVVRVPAIQVGGGTLGRPSDEGGP